MPAKSKNYPHWVYMETHSISTSDLPDSLKESTQLWRDAWVATSHSGRKLDANLNTASQELYKAIKSWHNTDIEFESYADKKINKPQKRATDDEILEFFYFKKRKKVSKEDLLKKGYRKDFFGMINLSTKHFKLTKTDGKNVYNLIKK